MGVFKRKDSPFFWLWLERPDGQKGTKEPTKIPCADKNLLMAQKVYESRMIDLARERTLPREQRLEERRATGSPGSSWCYIYFLKSSAGIKIGRARNLIKRLQVLQVGTHEDLELLLAIQGPVSLERELHQRFRALRFKREWFRADGDLLMYIEEVKRTRADGAEVLTRMSIRSSRTIPVSSRAVKKH